MRILSVEINNFIFTNILYKFHISLSKIIRIIDFINILKLNILIHIYRIRKGMLYTKKMCKYEIAILTSGLF